MIPRQNKTLVSCMLQVCKQIVSVILRKRSNLFPSRAEICNGPTSQIMSADHFGVEALAEYLEKDDDDENSVIHEGGSPCSNTGPAVE